MIGDNGLALVAGHPCLSGAVARSTGFGVRNARLGGRPPRMGESSQLIRILRTTTARAMCSAPEPLRPGVLTPADADGGRDGVVWHQVEIRAGPTGVLS